MQLIDPPFDYREELGDDDGIIACMEQSAYEKNWHAVQYWAEILIQRAKRERERAKQAK